MNCGQVEELLSVYLDDSFAVGETTETALELQHDIAVHLQDCVRCSTTLADFRRFDTRKNRLRPIITYLSPLTGLALVIFGDFFHRLAQPGSAKNDQRWTGGFSCEKVGA